MSKLSLNLSSDKVFLLDYRWFLDIYVSQGSVAMRLTFWGVVGSLMITSRAFTDESAGEIIGKSVF